MKSHSPILALIHEGLPVPEEDTRKIRFASGALDGIVTHHSGGGGKSRGSSKVKVLWKRIERAAGGEPGGHEALYKACLDGHALEVVDDLLEALVRAGIDRTALATIARRLVMEGAHRNPVKLGIAMLGASGQPSDLVAIRTLGRHEDFTLYAAVAASNLLDDPTDEWWKLAQQVNGWGKIHLVERLCEKAGTREDLREWLLRKGCSNSIMNEYLSACCARGGRLAESLAAEKVDRGLLEGACVIVRALISGQGGPAEGIDDYEEAPAAVDRLVWHLSEHIESLEQLECVCVIRRWAKHPEPATSKRAKRWPESLLRRVLRRCDKVLADPRWPERVRAAYSGTDSYQRWLAWTIAPEIDLDLWEVAFNRLDEDLLNEGLWFELSQRAEGKRLKRLVEFAESHLPLSRIATGVAEADGFGEKYKPHSCLEVLLQNMAGKGQFSAPLVQAALRNPVIRLRARAAELIAEQPNPGPEVSSMLKSAVENEPIKGIRKDLKTVLLKLKQK